MELACFDEQSYQLELHAYQTAFLDFKYEPPSFVYVEIGTNNKVPTMPSMVQPISITKPISPLKRWNRFKNHTLTYSNFYHTYSSCHVINEPMKGSEKFAKEQAELVDFLFIVLDNKVEPLEFLSTSLPLTPH